MHIYGNLIQWIFNSSKLYFIQLVIIHEHYNFEWYSPYMDLRFVKFWYSIPQKYHFKRNLSKKILKDTNIYKVWNKDFNYKHNI